ncbi:hypothetical protein C8J57DRAFT_1240920 [Mycena rebaudengoi]|nr:hypothetical protein C8J57DRAFT_1240920 [Mycena rebaudengoi]
MTGRLFLCFAVLQQMLNNKNGKHLPPMLFRWLKTPPITYVDLAGSEQIFCTLVNIFMTAISSAACEMLIRIGIGHYFLSIRHRFLGTISFVFHIFTGRHGFKVLLERNLLYTKNLFEVVQKLNGVFGFLSLAVDLEAGRKPRVHTEGADVSPKQEFMYLFQCSPGLRGCQNTPSIFGGVIGPSQINNDVSLAQDTCAVAAILSGTTAVLARSFLFGLSGDFLHATVDASL